MSNVRKRLQDAFAELKEYHPFYANGTQTPILPGLEVKKVGPVGIPISEQLAKQIIEQASQAPYGRGEETIVDTDVRKVWQLEPEQFSLNNSEWEGLLEQIVHRVKLTLGVVGTVKSELYKMLIYEKGSFFSPHRDSEKIEGMFATLIIALPSPHEGGLLLIQHDGKTQEIDFAQSENAFQIQYVAFYADCQHEIKPVTKGYRVCLVYNLALAKQKKQPTAPRTQERFREIKQLLSEWFQKPTRSKIVLPLSHSYTEASLSWDALKGEDRALAEVVQEITSSLGYHLYLCLMKFTQSSYPDGDDYGYGYDDDDHYEEEELDESEWDDSDDDEEDEEPEENEGGWYNEIYNEELTVSQWLSPSDTSHPLGTMNLARKELFNQGGFGTLPIRRTIHEATGNEGATLERWYHTAVLVLWPEDRYFHVLASQSQTVAVPILQEMCNRAKQPAKDEQLLKLAELLLSYWQFGHSHFTTPKNPITTPMLEVLEKLDSEELITRFVGEVLPRNYEGTEGEVLTRLCSHFGWETLQEPLVSFIKKQTATEDTLRSVNLVAVLQIMKPLAVSGRMTAARKKTCGKIVTELAALLEKRDEQPPRDAWYSREPARVGVLEMMIPVCAAVDDSEVIDALLTRAISKEDLYPLHEVLIPAARELAQEKSSKSSFKAGQKRLLETCIENLEARTATPIEFPKDWAQPTQLKCGCNECKELQRFLRDPKEQVKEFKMIQDRRSHLETEIRAHGCDLDLKTERRGSPHTLVCTKNRATYEREKAQFETDVELLKEMNKLAGARKK